MQTTEFNAINSVPTELLYSSLRPKGWYTRFKQWQVQPNSSVMYWQSNQIVRFLLQLTNGVMDPYRSHFQLQVQTFAADMPVGGVVMDVSAQSLIQSMLMTSNARQVERILQYDVLAAYLHDMGFSEWVCQNREWQGMGYDNRQTKRMKNDSYSQAASSYMGYGTTSGQQFIQQMGVPGSMSPTKTNALTASMVTAYTQTSTTVNAGTLQLGQQIANGNIPQHVSSANFMWNNMLRSDITIPDATSGKTANLRFQYQPQTTAGEYIDSASSINMSNPLLQIGVIPSNIKTNPQTKTLPTGRTYSVYYADQVGVQTVQNIAGTLTYGSHVTPNTTNLFGYTKPYSASFTKGTNEPLISPTIPQCQISYGKILAAPIPIPKRKFKIPLLSTVCGVLIPVDQFILIPLKALNNLLIQFTLNPYGMYSTGRQDIHQWDSTGIKISIPRKFYITNFVYNMHIYQFSQEQIQQHVSLSLTKQILVSGSSWMLSSQYQIANGNQVKNNWQVNTASQSLAEIVCLFLSNQYLRFPYCRKQFRLSNNITSFQVKFNSDYYPPQPILGNAGCPQMVDTTGDNSSFLELLLLSNNYLFTTNIPMPKINKYNFSLNGRIYDPTNTNTKYPIFPANPNTYIWTASSVNGDTALGQSYFHQNRHRGTAAFTFSFQPYGHSHNYMIGVDTRNARPFDVLFDTAAIQPFTTDQTLYIFTRVNVLVVYGENGVQVLGR